MADEEEEDVLFDLSSSSLLNTGIKPARSGGCSRVKAFSTACLCAGFFGLGLCIALPGPTLLDLQERTNTSTEQIMWIFTGRSVGHLGGSVIGGLLFDRLNGNLMLSISMLFTAVATAILPWSRNFGLLVTLVGFQGFTMGSLDTGGNVVCVNTWGKSSGPYMQTLHFTFGLGAFVAPFVAEPFLTLSQPNGSTPVVQMMPSVRNKIPVSKRDAQSPGLQPNTVSPFNVNSTQPGVVTMATVSIGTLVTKPKKPAAADGSEHKDPSGKEVPGKKEHEDVPDPDSAKTKLIDTVTTTNKINDTLLLTTNTTMLTTTPTTTPAAVATSTSAKVATINSNSPVSMVMNASTVSLNNSAHDDESKTKGEDLLKNIRKAFDNIDRVQFAYITVAVLLLIISVVFMLGWCCGQRTLVSLRNQELGKEFVRKEPMGFRIQILILLFCFYFLYVGIEVSFGGLLMSFAVDELKWSKKKGLLLTSTFWGAFASGRGLAIFFAKCLQPNIMLIVDLFLSFMAIAGMIIGSSEQEVFMWFCTAVLGVGLSSIFPTGITWAERYMKITGKTTAVFVVGSALGEMALPAVIGFFYQTKGPRWLLYISAGASLVSVMLYVIMQNMAFNKGERYERIEKYEVSRTPLILPEDDEGENLEMDSLGSDSVQLLPNRKKKVTFNLASESIKRTKARLNMSNGKKD